MKKKTVGEQRIWQPSLSFCLISLSSPSSLFCIEWKYNHHCNFPPASAAAALHPLICELTLLLFTLLFSVLTPFSCSSSCRSGNSCVVASWHDDGWCITGRRRWLNGILEREGISRACRSLPLRVRLLFYRPTSLSFSPSQGMNHALLCTALRWAFICNSFSFSLPHPSSFSDLTWL